MVDVTQLKRGLSAMRQWRPTVMVQFHGATNWEQWKCLNKAFDDLEAGGTALEALTRPAPDGEVVAYRYVYHDYAGRKVSRYGVHAELYNGHGPVEVHPLYTHPPRNDAVVEALTKSGFMMTETHNIGEFRGRKLMIGFQNADDADEAMAVIAKALKEARS